MYALMSWDRKIHSAHAKLLTYLQVRFGHLMWPNINKLFIWRETCFFDGSQLKKQDAVPYCVSKELSLEILFLLATGETVCKPFSSIEERPVFVRITVCLQASSELLSHPSLFTSFLDCSCGHVNTWSGSRSLRSSLFAARVQFAVRNSDGRMRFERRATSITCQFPVVYCGLYSKRCHVPCSWFWIGGEESSSLAVTHSTGEIEGDTTLKFP